MLQTEAAIRVLGISGSLRRASFSSSLIRLLAQAMKPAMEIELFELHDIPLYNEDIDGETKPASVDALNRAIRNSDGILFVTPEYNHGIPGVLKNALDWVSRPVFESSLKGKPVSVMSSSLAFTGGVRAQYQLRETLTSMLAHIVPGPEVVVPGIHTKFKDELFLDANTLEFMQRAIERLRAEIAIRTPQAKGAK
jgi:chromate reductase, NAD(P)H dehydrogenase (quinone)